MHCMRLEEDIKPITALKTGAAKLMRQLAEGRRAVVITQKGKARAVLMDVASYEQMRDAAMMRKLLAPGEADARANRTRTVAVTFARAHRRLGRRG